MPDDSNNLSRSGNGHAAPGTAALLDTVADPETQSSRPLAVEQVKPTNEQLLEYQSLLNAKVNALEAALAKAYRFAHYDELTGLPNRRLLLDRYMQAAPLATRHRQLLAMLFFDLDDFKGVNDRLGHAAGDMLLQQVAQRLASMIRKSDTACRYGGDEFVVLLTEIDEREQAIRKLEAIRAHLDPPYRVGSHSIQLTASIGLAVYPDDAQDFNELLSMSDRSMFTNKAGTRKKSGRKHDSKLRLHDQETATSKS